MVPLDPAQHGDQLEVVTKTSRTYIPDEVMRHVERLKRDHGPSDELFIV